MAKQQVITCFIGAILGALCVVLYQAATSNPLKKGYSLAVYYQVDTGSHLLDGKEAGHEITAALEYLNDWQHFFRREKGIAILEKQAEQGLVSAMSILSAYYIHFATDWGWDTWDGWYTNLNWLPVTGAHNYDKALYWARRAADHGSIIYLSMFLNLPALLEIREPAEEDIARVESYANVSMGAASALYNYYGQEINGKPRDAEKHAYWYSHYLKDIFMPGPAYRPYPVLTEERRLFKR